MQISAARTISAFTARVLFLGGLFIFVVALQLASVAALRGLGLGGSQALLLSGALILAVMIGASAGAQALTRHARARTEAARVAMGLPEGACCFVWRRHAAEAEFPWELEGDVRAAYPPLARKLGVEGYALIDFEVGADGAAKNLHCIDVWPSRAFYLAAADALTAARFRLRPGVGARFGPSYRIPFVFRIRGAARVRDRGRSAFGPMGYALRRAAGKCARAAGRGAHALRLWTIRKFSRPR